MPVQDDERERELVRMFNLDWDPAHQRAGVDALLDVEVDSKRYRFEVEVKSTTNDSVSTARDVGMGHIFKWRRKLFVIGFYSSRERRPELERSLCLTPTDMEPWIASIESYISADFMLAEQASRKLGIEDLFKVCGQQESYSMADAKRLHKKQWSVDQYKAAMDITVAGKPQISQARMLEILQLRSKYIAERGATLNNPHITKTHLAPFFDTDRELANNWAAGVRRIAKEFVTNNPCHPAFTLIGPA